MLLWTVVWTCLFIFCKWLDIQHNHEARSIAVTAELATVRKQRVGCLDFQDFFYAGNVLASTELRIMKREASDCGTKEFGPKKLSTRFGPFEMNLNGINLRRWSRPTHQYERLAFPFMDFG